MDMTIQIKEGKIVTALYAKSLALYHYIPPNSCHPPGVLLGLVFGQILWIHWLCSNNSNVEKELCLFTHASLTVGTSAWNYFPSLRRVLTMLPFTVRWRQRNKQQGRRLKSVDPANISFFTFHSTHKIHHLDQFNSFGIILSTCHRARRPSTNWKITWDTMSRSNVWGVLTVAISTLLTWTHIANYPHAQGWKSHHSFEQHCYE